MVKRARILCLSGAFRRPLGRSLDRVASYGQLPVYSMGPISNIIETRAYSLFSETRLSCFNLQTEFNDLRRHDFTFVPLQTVIIEDSDGIVFNL